MDNPRTEVDVNDVIALANRHPRVNVHRPGSDVGGHCIPVDPWFLISAFPEETVLLWQARDVNRSQAQVIIERAVAADLKPGSKIAILSLAYRANIDDARKSPAADVIAVLADQSFDWISHDPYVDAVSLKGYNTNI